VDDRVPYWIYTNRQDGPSLRGPSDSRTSGVSFGAGITRGMWHTVGAGESGSATPDTVDENIVWSSTSGYGPVSGIVTRMDLRTRQFRNVEVWPEANIGWPAEDARYRWQWTFPLLISPHDNETVYVGSQHVHRTTNGGQSWDVISPDLTTADTSKMGISGGLTPDNIAVEYCCVVYAIDESPARVGVLWAGTNDGLVHVSRDGGGTWTEVTGNIPDLPPRGVVRNIDASRWAAGKAYLTVDRHQMGDFAPYVYRTEDFGESWTRITDGIPEGPLSFARHAFHSDVDAGLADDRIDLLVAAASTECFVLMDRAIGLGCRRCKTASTLRALPQILFADRVGSNVFIEIRFAGFEAGPAEIDFMDLPVRRRDRRLDIGCQAGRELGIEDENIVGDRVTNVSALLRGKQCNGQSAPRTTGGILGPCLRQWH
jgi:hypothetical protein